jgi:hypothetical protein
MGMGGGSSPGMSTGDEAKYPTYQMLAHQSILNGHLFDNTTEVNYDTSMTVHKAVKEVYNDSPYTDFEPYDPDDDFAEMETRLDEYLALVDTSDNEVDFDGAIAAAIAAYDTDIAPTNQVDDLINAAEARANTTASRSISRMATGLRDIRGVMTTAFSMGIALIEAEKNLGLQEEDAKLRAYELRQRTDSIVRLANMHLDKKPLTLEYKRMGLAALGDILARKMTIKQDNVEFGVEMKVKDRLWKMELLQQYMNALAAPTGAVIPRSQTKRERQAAAVTQALSTGLQVGSSMGPQAGIAAAAGTFAVQSFGLDL